MKKHSKILMVLAVTLMLMITVRPAEPSCEEVLIGAGFGAAGAEALDATETTLEAKHAELQEQRGKALQDIQDANSPEEVGLAEKKLAVIDNTILANRAAVHTIQQIRFVQAEKTPEGRKDAVVTGVIGLALLGFEEWRRRLQGKKYTAMKYVPIVNTSQNMDNSTIRQC